MKAKEFIEKGGIWGDVVIFKTRIKDKDRFCEVTVGDWFGKGPELKIEGDEQLAKEYAGAEGYKYFIKRYYDQLR